MASFFALYQKAAGRHFETTQQLKHSRGDTLQSTQQKNATLDGLRFCLFVGVTRLELATSRPPDAYSNQLSYTPIS